jgi:hypothetical protein
MSLFLPGQDAGASQIAQPLAGQVSSLHELM